MDPSLFPQPASLPFVPTCIWLLLIFIMLISLLPLPCQPFLRSLFLRGKLLQPTSSPPKFTVPQSYFLHFYMLGAVFNTAVLFMSLYIACMGENLSLELKTQDAGRIVFLSLLLELQLLRRLYESLYVSKFSGVARMHVLAYCLGLIYYLMAPLSLFPRAQEMIIEMLQGLGNYSLGTSKPIHNKQGLQSTIHFMEIGWLYWIGGAIFIWGWIHQYRCHRILASLRSSKVQKKEEANVYKIPQGDWFEYVSCAHYFAEIVIYSSFVVATGGQSVDAWLLFIFVVLNLSIAASDTHRWYREKFDDYPSSRRAIFPFIY